MSLHHSAERGQQFLTEAQQEIAFLKNQTQQQTRNMVQMAQESWSVLQKKDEEVEQFKGEFQQSYSDTLCKCSQP